MFLQYVLSFLSSSGCLSHRKFMHVTKFSVYRNVIGWFLKHLNPIPVVTGERLHTISSLLEIGPLLKHLDPGHWASAFVHIAFVGPHIIGIIKSVVFSVWLLSLWILIMNFIVACIQDELMFLFRADWGLWCTMMILSAMCMANN